MAEVSLGSTVNQLPLHVLSSLILTALDVNIDIFIPTFGTLKMAPTSGHSSHHGSVTA